jgi:predicted permease
MDLSKADVRSVWDGKFVLFCFCATLLSVSAAAVYSLMHRDKAERGEIIQAAYRSSAAVLGIAFVNNIYGEATVAALMIVGTVPLYNVIAVTVLSVIVTAPSAKMPSECDVPPSAMTVLPVVVCVTRFKLSRV